MRWKWSLRARADLERIIRRIARENPRAAEQWPTKFRNRAKLAGRSPGLGRKVREVDRDDIREAVVGNYRLVYVVESKAVVIVTIFEGHMLPRDLEPW